MKNNKTEKKNRNIYQTVIQSIVIQAAEIWVFKNDGGLTIKDKVTIEEVRREMEIKK